MSDTLATWSLYVNNDGSVYFSRNGVLDVDCALKGLNDFPFGTTKCSLELGSWVYGPRYVDVYPRGEGETGLEHLKKGPGAKWAEQRRALFSPGP